MSIGILLAAGICGNVCFGQERPDAPEKVSVCELVSNPALYSHKLIELTGFVTRGFEESMLFDPDCESRFNIWIEIGGRGGTGVMYCCGSVPKILRDVDLVVEGVAIPLVNDKTYADFEKALDKTPNAVVRARLIGRFFAAGKMKVGKTEVPRGYGHMAMFHLFAVQQVLRVDLRDDPGLDHGASVEQPDLEREGCGNYTMLTNWELTGMLAAQKQAESGDRAWSLSDPRRVAEEGLAEKLGLAPMRPDRLIETRKTKSRIVYHWRPNGSKGPRFMIVVNRPYWLSFYAKDPEKTAWVVAAAYSICK